MTDQEILKAAEAIVRARAESAPAVEQPRFRDAALVLLWVRADMALDAMADYLTAQVVAELHTNPLDVREVSR